MKFACIPLLYIAIFHTSGLKPDNQGSLNCVKCSAIEECLHSKSDACFLSCLTYQPGVWPSDEEFCTGLKALVKCFGTGLYCGDGPWDWHCYATFMVQFMEDAGICRGSVRKTSEDETMLADKCIKRMVEVMKQGGHPCFYIGEFAQCILTENPTLQHRTIHKFREITTTALANNWPHKFGNVTVGYCKDWSSTYEHPYK